MSGPTTSRSSSSLDNWSNGELDDLDAAVSTEWAASVTDVVPRIALWRLAARIAMLFCSPVAETEMECRLLGGGPIGFDLCKGLEIGGGVLSSRLFSEN